MPSRRPHLVFVAVLVGFLNIRSLAQEPDSPQAFASGVDEVSTTDPTGADSQSVQTSDSDGQETTATRDKGDEKKRSSRGSPVFAPLPISSPALGSGVIPVVGYLFPFSKSDHISPTSVIGAAGLFTNNGTRGFALGGELYFRENTYKVTAGYAHGNLNYNVYGPGIIFGSNAKLPLKQTGEAFFGEFLRRLWWDFFLGPRFFTGNSLLTLRINNIGSFPTPPDLGIQTNLRAIGFRVQRDTRPNHFYPIKGTLTDFTSDFFGQSIGSKYTFQSYKLTYNRYFSLADKQVLAWGSYFCGTEGQPPFYGNCIYGAQNQLRGYTAGRYFDRYLMTSQAEYRLVLPWRVGLVVFGGIGGVIPGADQYLYRNASFLPSGGGGLRFELSKKYHFNLRADIAEGKDGHVFSMGVGEAF